MRKVEKITEEVIENEQEVKELLSKQSIEDLYEFFLAKDSTLTEEEFNDEVYDILEYYLKNISKEIKKLEENETKQIVGGKSDIIKKSLSASLCLLTLTSGINASASPTSVNPSSQKAVSVWNNKKQEKSVTFGEKIKAWVKKNKKALIITGSVTAAVIAGIIITVVVYKHKKNVEQPKNSINVPINQRPAEQSNNNSEKSTTEQSKNLEQSPTTTPAVQPKKDEKSPSTASNGQTENEHGQQSTAALELFKSMEAQAQAQANAEGREYKSPSPSNGNGLNSQIQEKFDQGGKIGRTEEDIEELKKFYNTNSVIFKKLSRKLVIYSKNAQTLAGYEAGATRSQIITIRDVGGPKLGKIDNILERIDKNSGLECFRSDVEKLKKDYLLFFGEVLECCKTFEQTPEQMESQRELFVAVAERRKRVDEVTK